MKPVLSLLACMILALGSGAAGSEVACQNLPGAGFKPGSLKLPLVVHERSGVERKGAMVSSGVPFPPSFLADVGKLGVTDKDGKPVVAQAVVMIPWRQPAYDDSVQWALVSFLADVPANGTATYYLTDDGKAASPASPLKVTKGDKQLTVETGAASFAIPLEGEALLSRAAVGGAEVIGGAGLRGIVAAGDWPDRGLKSGDRLAAVHDAAGVAVEESGPARAVVCIKGTCAPGDKDKRFYDFTARLYFSAGSPSVRVIYTISNGRLDPAFGPTPDGKGKSRFAYVWPIKDASLAAELALGADVTASTTAEGKPLSQALAAEPMSVCQESFGGYKVSLGGKELAAGGAHPGVLDVSGGGRGLAVARRYFREEWPGALAASAKELRIGLFPGEAQGPFHLHHGQRKSWDLRLTLHDGKAPDLQAACAEQDALLLFRPEPAWMVRAAGVTGAWSAGLALAGKPGKSPLRREPGRLEGRSNGWDKFGVISSWNAGGGHWNEGPAFLNWVTAANGAEFDSSEVSTLWAADHCPIHFDRPDYSAYFPYLAHGNADHCRLKVLAYPGCANRVPWGRPDTGHMGMWMWVEYYLLTGDARCREAVGHLGDMARGYLWRFTHDDKKDGTGPLNYQFPDCRKRDPDADPDFKLDTRYVGWPLYCLAQGYQFTGDPDMLTEARAIARAFRNTARACPIGQLVRDAAGKDGTEPTEYSGNITRGNDGMASQVRECRRSSSLVASNFYSGIIIYGLREYYLVSRDVEALDTLVGQIDRFCHHSLIRNPEGQPAGWTYIFGDYWGPYTWEDTTNPRTGKPGAGFTSSNGLASDAIARIYHLTGRADLLAVVEAANKANGNNNMLTALVMATAHPKVDQAPPAAVKDLAAEALGGGKVKLTWTAPSGDGEKGRAAWYQVKWSAAKIVERVQGWPDRTEPLPGTRKEWLDRAAAFNARQRAFWAANNLPNAPKPAAAGTPESLVAEGLPVGEASFALKSWDDADNLSELSNVATVTVK